MTAALAASLQAALAPFAEPTAVTATSGRVAAAAGRSTPHLLEHIDEVPDAAKITRQAVRRQS